MLDCFNPFVLNQPLGYKLTYSIGGLLLHNIKVKTTHFGGKLLTNLQLLHNLCYIVVNPY